MTEYLQRRFYSDPSYDGTKRFYDWVREYVGPESRVLNLGAGPETQSPVRTLKGEVAEVVGADVDEVVLRNGELDRAVMIENGRLPLPDGYFDVVLSDYVLEHVDNPLLFFQEVRRVLKPGKSFFFRTPNIAHYVTLFSALTPHWVHEALAHRVRANPAGMHEPWPTFYRVNSRRAIRSTATAAGFRDSELRMVEAEPSYLRFAALPFAVGILYERTVNSNQALAGLRANVFGRLTA